MQMRDKAKGNYSVSMMEGARKKSENKIKSSSSTLIEQLN
jgi:hypothetical protein